MEATLLKLAASIVACAVVAGCGPERHRASTHRSPEEPGSPAVGRAVLTRDAKNPLSLALAPSGDVYFIERSGELRRYDHATGQVSDALVLEVDTAHENGLLGLALDPDFATSRYGYLYYSLPLEEPLPVGAPPGRNVLARFTARADGSFEPATRVELLSVPSERLCCHEGGSLAFGPDGLLFLSVGDNTNPFGSSGAAPLDGQPGRELYDARRTAQNPFDLRGKILRIAPDGSIPAGNLFPPSGELGRPEIFVLGNRNPFRIAVDPRGGALYWGEIGPDASVDSELGPRGYDELNRATAPGNFGWPYCIAAQLPYVERDFATGALGAPYDCGDSVPALAAYDYDTPTYPALGSSYAEDGTFLGRAVMAGGVYRPAPHAEFALPERFDGALLMTDWTRDLVAAVSVGEDGELGSIERLFEGERFHRPIDLEVSPDGAVYVLEFGSGFWGDNADAQLSRLEHASSRSPVAVITTSQPYGSPPLTVELSGAASRAGSPEEALVDYGWDFDGDGNEDASGARVTHVFETPGTFSASLVVRSSSGKRSLPVAERIVVGNSAPSVHVLRPDPQATLHAGRAVTLEGYATDPEDGDAACGELVWNIGLGHNAHSHPLTTLSGCSASFVPELGDHADSSDTEHLIYAIELVYTDHGGPNGEAPLTARQGLRVDAAH